MNLQPYNLAEVYSSDQQPRYDHIRQKFKDIYHAEPEVVVRAPGRVNLIGQHLDYEGYGVLPFAIQKDCVIAARTIKEDVIQVNHMDNEYPASSISNNPFEDIKYPHPYLQYFFAGYKAGTVEVEPVEGMPQEVLDSIKNRKYKGLQLLIEGNLPIASGLSSSSSFCVCSALLSTVVNGFGPYVNRQTFINRAIKYERLVGTACGGMDQSISVMGIRQSCLFIEFNPIKATVVELPKGFKFVIMNSLEESKKLQTVGTRFNKRVCQCLLAVRFLCKRMAIPADKYAKWSMLRDVQQYLGVSLEVMSHIVDTFIPRKDYTREELENELGCHLQEVLKDIAASEIVLKCNTVYNIYGAAKHVYTEAARVLKFIEVCKSHLADDAKGKLLGYLMNESQKSCKELYNCSSQLIDEVTTMARQEGAYGSRLTGAGWGGCTVSLVPQAITQNFIKTMKERFYAQEKVAKKVKELGIDNVIFETIPAHGASLIK